MQMRVDDDCDVRRLIAGFFEQRFGKTALAVYAVNLRLFIRPFFSDAGFDEDFFGRRLDE